MAPGAVGEQPVRQPLAAPVDRQHVEARAGQEGRDGGKFFDIFGAARKQQHGARGIFGPPQCHAQAHIIVAAQPIGLGRGFPAVGKLMERGG